MSDGDKRVSLKLWALQNKVTAIAGMIVALGAAGVAVIAGGNKINDSINERIQCQAAAVANFKDSLREEKRMPIDNLILCELKAIRMEQRKNAFMNKKQSSVSSWEKAEAAWKSDSIFNEKYPTK
jgi:hypothetical protein